MKLRILFYVATTAMLFSCAKSEDEDPASLFNNEDFTTLTFISNHYDFNVTEGQCDFSEYPLYSSYYGEWNGQLQKNMFSLSLPLNLKANKATYTIYDDFVSYKLVLNYQLSVKNGNPGYVEYYNSKWLTIDTFSVDTLSSSPIFKNIYFENDSTFQKDTTAFSLLHSLTFK